jgi:TetR/AcrR family fatty acid metabolism transcriptional regulator
MTKKEKIIEVATQIFAKNGFLNTKIATIAKNAGVATGSVYLYFDNKDNILEEIYLNSWHAIKVKLEEILAMDITASEMFDKYFDFLSGLATSNAPLVRMLVRDQHFLSAERMFHLKEKITEIKLQIVQIIKKGQKDGLFDSEHDAISTAAIILGGTWYYFVSKIDVLENSNIKESMKKQLSDTFLTGLMKR